MEATMKLVSSHGMEGVSTALIANEANVGMGTLYRYFESKEVLLRSIFELLREEMLLVVMEGIAQSETSVFVQFKSIVINLTHYYVDHRLEFQFLQKYSDSSYMKDSYLDESAIILEPISHILSSGGKDFTFRKLPVEMIFAMIYGPMIFNLQLVHLGKIELTEGRLNTLVEAIWTSITEPRK